MLEFGQIAHHRLKLLALTGRRRAELLFQHRLDRLLESFLDGVVHQRMPCFHLAAAGENAIVLGNGNFRFEPACHITDPLRIGGMNPDADILPGGRQAVHRIGDHTGDLRRIHGQFAIDNSAGQHRRQVDQGRLELILMTLDRCQQLAHQRFQLRQLFVNL